MTTAERKTEMVANELPPPFNRPSKKVAQRGGKDGSECLSLLMEELRERNSLPARLSLEDLEDNR